MQQQTQGTVNTPNNNNYNNFVPSTTTDNVPLQKRRKVVARRKRNNSTSLKRTRTESNDDDSPIDSFSRPKKQPRLSTENDSIKITSTKIKIQTSPSKMFNSNLPTKRKRVSDITCEIEQLELNDVKPKTKKRKITN